MSEDRKPVIPPERVGALTQALRTFQLVWELLKDSRVPLFPKLVMLASVIYVISPVDFVPDVILGLGQVDDLAVFMFAVAAFIELCPRDIVQEHRRKIAGVTGSDEVVDGTYRVIDDKDHPADK
jgi:uncharacterized membrane protein YkvA (DUF1232 family)